MYRCRNCGDTFSYKKTGIEALCLILEQNMRNSIIEITVAT